MRYELHLLHRSRNRLGHSYIGLWPTMIGLTLAFLIWPHSVSANRLSSVNVRETHNTIPLRQTNVGPAELVPSLRKRLPIRGVVRAYTQATISTDLTARILRIGFREGQSFKRGDLLIEFDCRRLTAEHASAVAIQREMSGILNGALILKKQNANSRQDVETARARADKARADAEAVAAQLRECKISAPYDGRVTALMVHEHEMPRAGTNLISVAAKNKLELELIVPSRWLNWLSRGRHFQYVIDETGDTYQGTVKRLGGVVDTVSQTVKIFGSLRNPTDEIIPGMSGTAIFGSMEK